MVHVKVAFFLFFLLVYTSVYTGLASVPGRIKRFLLDDWSSVVDPYHFDEMRIRILLVTSMRTRIRILPVALMRIRILPLNLMGIQIHNTG